MNDKITNIPLLRKKNIDTVLRVIWEKKITTRKELSRITSITIPTISNIISLLKEKNLITIGEKGESTGGRNPELIEFNSASYYVIGVSLKVYKVQGFITDLFGKKVKEFVIGADYSGENANILGQLNIVIENLLDNFKAKEKILGIGISFPGTIDSNTGIVLDSPIIGNGIGVNIIDFIEGKFGYNTFVGNNANLCALNEYWFGKGRNKNNILFIFAGYGIGSGMVINGEIYTGWKNAAGEIGHSVIKIDGEKCYCGSYGCLETIASYPALFSEFIRRVKMGEKTKLREIADKMFSIKLVHEIFKNAKDGDELSITIIKRIGRYLGIATANLINILNPEIIIIGGDYIKVKDIIEETIVETARFRAWHPSKDTEIVFTDFGLDACVYGASTIVIKNILDRGLDYINSFILKQKIENF